jgi:CheY-like chemotaxis protein
MSKRLISLMALFTFFLNSMIGPDLAYAQSVLSLPEPGQMVALSQAYVPVMIKGLKVHPEDPLLFDFIIDSGKSDLKTDSPEFKTESEKLIKYFLASLTIKEDDLWVNLSPYEKDRMVTDELGKTALGRDMLAQDYILKQLTASLIYPEKDLGKKFWDKVYAEAQAKYGTTDIPLDTFNKVWITADKARVLEKNDAAYVVGAHLKVMLESDYLAQANVGAGPCAGPECGRPQGAAPTSEVAKQIIREIILPALETEVNSGQNFAVLRQMFYAMILASWYKLALKDAFLNQVYSNQAKTGGVQADDPAVKEKIYAQYLEAYKKGVFNYIKEDAEFGDTVPRKYFSGGLQLLTPAHPIERVRTLSPGDDAMKAGDMAMVTASVQGIREGVETAGSRYVLTESAAPRFFERRKPPQLMIDGVPATFIGQGGVNWAFRLGDIVYRVAKGKNHTSRINVFHEAQKAGFGPLVTSARPFVLDGHSTITCEFIDPSYGNVKDPVEKGVYSVHDLIYKEGERLTAKEEALIAELYRDMLKSGYFDRDFKPANVVIGRGHQGYRAYNVDPEWLQKRPSKLVEWRLDEYWQPNMVEVLESVYDEFYRAGYFREAYGFSGEASAATEADAAMNATLQEVLLLINKAVERDTHFDEYPVRKIFFRGDKRYAHITLDKTTFTSTLKLMSGDEQIWPDLTVQGTMLGWPWENIQEFITEQMATATAEAAKVKPGSDAAMEAFNLEELGKFAEKLDGKFQNVKRREDIPFLFRRMMNVGLMQSFSGPLTPDQIVSASISSMGRISPEQARAIVARDAADVFDLQLNDGRQASLLIFKNAFVSDLRQGSTFPVAKSLYFIRYNLAFARTLSTVPDPAADQNALLSQILESLGYAQQLLVKGLLPIQDRFRNKEGVERIRKLTDLLRSARLFRENKQYWALVWQTLVGMELQLQAPAGEELSNDQKAAVTMIARELKRALVRNSYKYDKSLEELKDLMAKIGILTIAPASPDFLPSTSTVFTAEGSVPVDEARYLARVRTAVLFLAQVGDQPAFFMIPLDAAMARASSGIDSDRPMIVDPDRIVLTNEYSLGDWYTKLSFGPLCELIMFKRGEATKGMTAALRLLDEEEIRKRGRSIFRKEYDQGAPNDWKQIIRDINEANMDKAMRAEDLKRDILSSLQAGPWEARWAAARTVLDYTNAFTRPNILLAKAFIATVMKENLFSTRSSAVKAEVAGYVLSHPGVFPGMTRSAVQRLKDPALYGTEEGQIEVLKQAADPRLKDVVSLVEDDVLEVLRGPLPFNSYLAARAVLLYRRGTTLFSMDDEREARKTIDELLLGMSRLKGRRNAIEKEWLLVLADVVVTYWDKWQISTKMTAGEWLAAVVKDGLSLKDSVIRTRAAALVYSYPQYFENELSSGSPDQVMQGREGAALSMFPRSDLELIKTALKDLRLFHDRQGQLGIRLAEGEEDYQRLRGLIGEIGRDLNLTELSWVPEDLDGKAASYGVTSADLSRASGKDQVEKFLSTLRDRIALWLSLRSLTLDRAMTTGKPQVLIVEDHSGTLDQWKVFVQDLGDSYGFLYANNVAEAKRMLQENSGISLVITDTHFNGDVLNGGDLVDHIREKYGDLPVVPVSDSRKFVEQIYVGKKVGQVYEKIDAIRNVEVLILEHIKRDSTAPLGDDRAMKGDAVAGLTRRGFFLATALTLVPEAVAQSISSVIRKGLVNQFKSRDPAIRKLAVQKSSSRRFSHDPVVANALVEVLQKDPETSVRLAAVQALGVQLDQKGVTDALKVASGKDKDPGVRAAARQLLPSPAGKAKTSDRAQKSPEEMAEIERLSNELRPLRDAKTNRTFTRSGRNQTLDSRLEKIIGTSGRDFGLFIEFGLGGKDRLLGLQAAPTYFDWLGTIKKMAADGMVPADFRLVGIDNDPEVIRDATVEIKNARDSRDFRNAEVVLGSYDDLPKVLKTARGARCVRGINTFMYLVDKRDQEALLGLMAAALDDGDLFIDSNYNLSVIYERRSGRLVAREIDFDPESLLSIEFGELSRLIEKYRFNGNDETGVADVARTIGVLLSALKLSGPGKVFHRSVHGPAFEAFVTTLKRVLPSSSADGMEITGSLITIPLDGALEQTAVPDSVMAPGDRAMKGFSAEPDPSFFTGDIRPYWSANSDFWVRYLLMTAGPIVKGSPHHMWSYESIQGYLQQHRDDEGLDIKAEYYYIPEIAAHAKIKLDEKSQISFKKTNAFFRRIVEAKSPKEIDALVRKLKSFDPRMSVVLLKWLGNTAEQKTDKYPREIFVAQTFLKRFVDLFFTELGGSEILRSYMQMINDQARPRTKDLDYDEILVVPFLTGSHVINEFAKANFLRVRPLMFTRAMARDMGAVETPQGLQMTPEGEEYLREYLEKQGILLPGVKEIIFLDSGQRGTLHGLLRPVLEEMGIGSQLQMIYHRYDDKMPSDLGHGLNEEPGWEARADELLWANYILDDGLESADQVPSYLMANKVRPIVAPTTRRWFLELTREVVRYYASSAALWKVSHTRASGKGAETSFTPEMKEVSPDRAMETSPMDQGSISGAGEEVLQGKTLLVVDDSKPILDAIPILLKPYKLNIIKAAGGQEALDILQKQKVDAVLTDLEMPGMDGMELTRTVQKIYPATKILMNTTTDADIREEISTDLKIAVVSKTEPQEIVQGLVALFAEKDKTDRAMTAEEALKGKTIIYADDDDSLRKATMRLFTVTGLKVIAVSNGREAWDKYNELEGNVDGVLTDNDMPEMTGSQLATKLREANPSFPVVIMTGVVDEQALKKIREDTGRVVLTKPTPAEIIFRNLAEQITGQKFDSAMNPPGGIELNAKKLEMDVTKQGAGVSMKIDPALLEEFRSGDFSGVVPVIIRITPIASPSAILGMTAEEIPTAAS